MKLFNTANTSVMRAEPITEDDAPKRPTFVKRFTNDTEETVQLGTANDMAVDLCYLRDDGDLIISLSDANGDIVDCVKISPVFVQNYLNRIAAGQQKSA